MPKGIDWSPETQEAVNLFEQDPSLIAAYYLTMNCEPCGISSGHLSDSYTTTEMKDDGYSTRDEAITGMNEDLEAGFDQEIDLDKVRQLFLGIRCGDKLCRKECHGRLGMLLVTKEPTS